MAVEAGAVELQGGGKKVRELPGKHRFLSFEEVRKYCEEGRYVLYWPPLNHRPVCVWAKTEGEGVKVVPGDREADPFMADEGHLERFWKEGDNG